MDIAESIIYEDCDIIVLEKIANIPVQTRRMGEMDYESILNNYLAGKGEVASIGVVHRLDQPVSGLMVFGKNKMATAALNKQMQNQKFHKKYQCKVKGVPKDEQGIWEDYLKKDGRLNMSKVVNEKDPQGKKASLSYKVLEHEQDSSVLEITLHTGRHHQIRVQTSHRGHYILGDQKYGEGKKGEELCLYSCSLEFEHPVTRKKVVFYKNKYAKE